MHIHFIHTRTHAHTQATNAIVKQSCAVLDADRASIFTVSLDKVWCGVVWSVLDIDRASIFTLSLDKVWCELVWGVIPWVWYHV